MISSGPFARLLTASILILGLAVMVGGIVFSILLGVMGMSELVV